MKNLSRVGDVLEELRETLQQSGRDEGRWQIYERTPLGDIPAVAHGQPLIFGRMWMAFSSIKPHRMLNPGKEFFVRDEHEKCEAVYTPTPLPFSDSPNSWPEDYPLENGNYISRCVQCQAGFVGHKRRHLCKVCSTANETRFNALTPEEKLEHFAKCSAAVMEALLVEV
jgi:hypothetical protein